MFTRLRARMTYANVIATLALFIALGGSSYAALMITGRNVKDGTLTGADIKNNSVTSADIRDGSLLARDFRAGQLTSATSLQPSGGPAGPQGPAGPAGAKGDQGPKGDPGPVTAPLASGETESGGWAGSDAAPANGRFMLSFAFFHPRLSGSVDGTHIVYVTGASATHCGGVGSADPGYLCVYEAGSSKISATAPRAVLVPDGSIGATPYGFAVSVAEDTTTGSAPMAFLAGSFAYTAP